MGPILVLQQRAQEQDGKVEGKNQKDDGDPGDQDEARQ